jgi:hypothetical protein
MREMQQSGRFAGLSVHPRHPEGPTRVVATNYGYGIAFSQECDARLVVAHSGGLPASARSCGCCPNTAWASFVMANRTYAPAGGMAARPWRSCAARERSCRASSRLHTLVATRDQIASLLDRWDDGAARALAADNFFLDRPLPERRDEVARCASAMAACRAGDVKPENWLRGRFRASASAAGSTSTSPSPPPSPRGCSSCA